MQEGCQGNGWKSKYEPINLTKEKVVEYLGTEKFKEEPLDLNPQVGVVNGLAGQL